MRSPSKPNNATIRQPKLASGGGEAQQRPGVGPEQVELDQHAVVGVMERDHFVALVAERHAASWRNRRAPPSSPSWTSPVAMSS